MGFEAEAQDILRATLTSTPEMRSNLGQIVSRPWFQDPLLKALRYLENLEFKEQAQKV